MAVVVVTGANRGIGLALAQASAERGDRVIAACRQKSPGLNRPGIEIFEKVEVTDDGAVAAFAAAMAGRSVDILINNAGLYRVDGLASLDWDGVREQFEINALGPIRVTRALLPNLHEGSKVAIITSRSGSIGDNGSGNTYGYRMSKAAVNMAGVNLAIDLKPKGVAVVLLHPGMVATGLGHNSAAVTPALSASRLLARLDELTLAGTGKFLHAEGHELPW